MKEDTKYLCYVIGLLILGVVFVYLSTINTNLWLNMVNQFVAIFDIAYAICLLRMELIAK